MDGMQDADEDVLLPDAVLNAVDDVHGRPLRDVRLGEDLGGMDAVLGRLLPDEQLHDSLDGMNEGLGRVPPGEPLDVLPGGMDEVLGRQSLDADLGDVQELLEGSPDGTQHVQHVLRG